MNWTSWKYCLAATLPVGLGCCFASDFQGPPKNWSVSEKDWAADQVSIASKGDYSPAWELREQTGTPKGRIQKYHLDNSAIYPGVSHDYWLYLPAQYSGKSPVCLMVFLDGEDFLSGEIPAPTLMDNLIEAHEIPLMIGLFINAGPNGPGLPVWGGSDNRSVEYDTVSSQYARFLVEDVLPRVKALYNVSSDPACHGILGVSSSGAAAFGVAWYRPDAFGKVISVVGSFVDIRGANSFPSMIRHAERKPIRAFLEDGTQDLDVVFGNWPLANQQMASALAYRDYDYRFELGVGGHNTHHFASLAADAMRWLWRH